MTNSTDTRYNGWKNYETWVVKLWMDNEEPVYRSIRELTRECWGESGDKTPNEFLSHLENARVLLANRLKEMVEEGAPTVTGMYADLLNAALSEVDWIEIADACIEDEELKETER